MASSASTPAAERMALMSAAEPSLPACLASMYAATTPVAERAAGVSTRRLRSSRRRRPALARWEGERGASGAVPPATAAAATATATAAPPASVFWGRACCSEGARAPHRRAAVRRGGPRARRTNVRTGRALHRASTAGHLPRSGGAPRPAGFPRVAAAAPTASRARARATAGQQKKGERRRGRALSLSRRRAARDVRMVRGGGGVGERSGDSARTGV